MKYSPYPYQQRVFNELIAKFKQGIRSQVCQMVTRSGKSIIATMLIEYFAGEAIYFVGHTNILLTQMSDELVENDIKHGILAPWSPQLKYRVQVISKDTLFNRVKKMKESGWREPKLIIIDEAHVSLSKRYLEILDLYPDALLVGLTATPQRLDGKGLGSIYEHMVIGPSTKDLQKQKKLCPIETFAVDFDDSGMHSRNGDYINSEVLERVDKPAVLKNLVYWWEKIAKNEKTLTFCASIKHAQDMAEAFTEAGYPSVAISSNDGKEGIKDKLNRYYAGEYINLCSVDLFIVGFTVKECSCIIQARPTQSIVVYLQSVGRGTIYLPGKVLKNIDAVNNYTRFGLPEDDREWSLEGKGKKEIETSKYKKCPECYHPVPIGSRVCEHCGFSWVEVVAKGSRMPEEKDGRLIRIQGNNLVLEVARKAKTLQEAIDIAGADGQRIWVDVLRNKVS